jgi:hypothetical protein
MAMQRMREKLSYSNVMVTVLAVIVLGGGTAYAATAGLTPKPNSVGPIQLKDEAVGLQQLVDESVNASKIKDGAVTPEKLSASAKGQLKGEKGSKGEQGATGPGGATGSAGQAGAAGAPGAPGSPGASTALAVEHVTASSANDATKEKEVQAVCPSGLVLGGGYVLNSHGNANLSLRAVRSYANAEGTWLVRGLNSGTEEVWELTVVAVCTK